MAAYIHDNLKIIPMYIVTDRNYDGESLILVFNIIFSVKTSNLRNGMGSSLYTKYIKPLLNFKGHKNIARTAVSLAYKIHGDANVGGTPVIILHGLLGSKRNWESMSKKISEAVDKTVIAVDVRNHGESPHHASHTYAELVSDVTHLMNNLNIKQADVIGHSMGGRTGMVLALTEPTKVSCLVVVDISPVSTAGALNDFMPNLLNAMKTIDFGGIKDLNSAKRHVKEKLVESKAIDSDSMGFILMNVGVKPDKSVGWSCNVEVLSKYFMDIATFPNLSGKVYNGPTLFVGGGESPYIPPSDIDGIRKFFPKADLKYVEDAGHNVHAESPSEFQQIVTHFLLRNKK